MLLIFTSYVRLRVEGAIFQGLLFTGFDGRIFTFDEREGGSSLPNTKSTEKRVRQALKSTARNRRMKSMLKTAIRHFEESLNSGDQDTLQTKLIAADRQIDRAQAKGIIHKNNAARKKSRLSRLYNQRAAG